MKPLIVLLSTFVISIIIQKAVWKKFDVALSARVGMSFMLVFSAIGHFVFTEGMAMMIPEIFPFKTLIVFATGALEILAAAGLHTVRFRRNTGLLLILFFVCVLPANVYAALLQIDLQKATYSGPGIEYLWFRIPLQIFFIIWVYFSSVISSKSRG